MAGKGQRGKSIAYALATQQAHRTGKSPKGFRTAEGVRTAKRKYDEPKSHYTRTADPKRSKSAGVKEAAGPPPSIPTPQFPLGLQQPKPKTVGTMSTTSSKPGQLARNAQNYTQVHAQPPSVNLSPHSGLKSAQPPPVK
jgi:hypothetical protein